MSKNPTISSRVRALRKQKALTQQDLADKLGISRQSIISVESGRCLPSLSLALHIASFFDTSVEEMFDDLFNLTIESNPKQGGSEMVSLRETLDDLMDEGLVGRMPTVGLTTPTINVSQTDKNVMVEANIPGFKEDEIDIEIGEDVIRISGEKKEEKEDKGRNWYHREFEHKSFTRSVPLPARVKTDKAEASLKDGMLTITVPKVEPVKPKTTKIKVKKQ